MKRIHPLLLLLAVSLSLQAQTATLDIDATQKGIDISPSLYGLFYEEINHAGEGGLYAELIQNRSFEVKDQGIRNTRFDNGRGERFGRAANPDLLPSWSTVGGATTQVLTEDLMNSVQKRAVRLTAGEETSKKSPAGLSNCGFWGIKATKGDKYTLSFWAKADAKGKVSFTAGLKDADEWKAQKTFARTLTTEWKKYTVTFKGKSNADEAEFYLLLNAPGSICLDMVSLFPPTWKNRPNGCRRDLAEKLAALHPTFVRFPGGCFVEGMSRETAYEWKRTIGPVEERPGHMNANWGYPCTDGMGYHEYLQLCEDLGAEPLYVVNVGIWHGGVQPYDQLDEYVQNALDAIEYANGDASTVWGAKRVANGHPKPFGLRLIEVGNENYQADPNAQSDHYAERYAQFQKAIKAKYPYVQLIGNVESWGTDFPTWRNDNPVDLLDEHYYRSPSWFAGKYHHYDNYDRQGPKVYCGEYAVTSNCGEGNLQAALGEAVFMMGMENNSDVVAMASYAPIFVNVHDRHWMPDMIRFDAAESWASPSYYVQGLMAENVGTSTVKSILTQTKPEKDAHFQVGLGTWNTTADYKDLTVTTYVNGKATTTSLGSADELKVEHGDWALGEGLASQKEIAERCVAVAKTVFEARDYDVTVQARRTGGDEGFLLLFDYTGEENYRWFNVAGWNNTQHAVEDIYNGGKAQPATTRGRIEDGRWYTLKVEVRGDHIATYIDERKVLDYTAETPDVVYANAEVDSRSGELIVKVVNFGDTDVPVKMSLAEGSRYNLAKGRLTLLSGDALDENTKAEPKKVVPVKTAFVLNEEGSYNAPANSLSIIRVK